MEWSRTLDYVRALWEARRRVHRWVKISGMNRLHQYHEHDHLSRCCAYGRLHGARISHREGHVKAAYLLNHKSRKLTRHWSSHLSDCMTQQWVVYSAISLISIWSSWKWISSCFSQKLCNTPSQWGSIWTNLHLLVINGTLGLWWNTEKKRNTIEKVSRSNINSETEDKYW